MDDSPVEESGQREYVPDSGETKNIRTAGKITFFVYGSNGGAYAWRMGEGNAWGAVYLVRCSIRDQRLFMEHVVKT